MLNVGTNDVLTGMTMARSRLNLANVLDEATNAGVGVFVVGLTPTLDPEMNRKIEVLPRGAGRRLLTPGHHLRRLLPPAGHP